MLRASGSCTGSVICSYASENPLLKSAYYAIGYRAEMVSIHSELRFYPFRRTPPTIYLVATRLSVYVTHVMYSFYVQ